MSGDISFFSSPGIWESPITFHRAGSRKERRWSLPQTQTYAPLSEGPKR
jgi:hypothetical protein